jgi:hypothetical protein
VSAGGVEPPKPDKTDQENLQVPPERRGGIRPRLKLVAEAVTVLGILVGTVLGVLNYLRPAHPTESKVEGGKVEVGSVLYKTWAPKVFYPVSEQLPAPSNQPPMVDTSTPHCDSWERWLSDNSIVPVVEQGKFIVEVAASPTSPLSIIGANVRILSKDRVNNQPFIDCGSRGAPDFLGYVMTVNLTTGNTPTIEEISQGRKLGTIPPASLTVEKGTVQQILVNFLVEAGYVYKFVVELPYYENGEHKVKTIGSETNPLVSVDQSKELKETIYDWSFPEQKWIHTPDRPGYG